MVFIYWTSENVFFFLLCIYSASDHWQPGQCDNESVKSGSASDDWATYIKRISTSRHSLLNADSGKRQILCQIKQWRAAQMFQAGVIRWVIFHDLIKHVSLLQKKLLSTYNAKWVDYLWSISFLEENPFGIWDSSNAFKKKKIEIFKGLFTIWAPWV